MNPVRAFWEWLVGNLMALASLRTGDELLYVLAILLGVLAGGAMVVKGRREPKLSYKVACIVVTIAAAFAIVAMRDHLSVNTAMPAAGSGLDAVAERTYVRVAVPMPWLRRADFPDDGRSSWIDGADVDEYRKESGKPGNKLATFATVAAHWVAMVAFVAGSSACLAYLMRQMRQRRAVAPSTAKRSRRRRAG
jgi:hypothetical protein